MSIPGPKISHLKKVNISEGAKKKKKRITVAIIEGPTLHVVESPPCIVDGSLGI